MNAMSSGMSAAYVFQAINLLVSILIVPILLHYLDANQYVIWTVFTIFGAASLQAQNAIQPVSIREVSRAFNGRDPTALTVALKNARLAYGGLALFMLSIVTPGGLVYVLEITRRDARSEVALGWLIFSLSYCLNYAFATNTTVLMGMQGVERQNNINSLTRVLYFGMTLAFLSLGYSIFGMSVSFALAVLVGIFLSARSARRWLRELLRPSSTQPSLNDSPALNHLPFIGKYAIYTVSSFLIYNGMLLLAALHFPRPPVASYGLSLQAGTLLVAFAQAPLQVWLVDFVRASIKDDSQEVISQLARSILGCNAIYLVGALAFDFFGETLLHRIASRVALPPSMTLVGASIAFLIELNIALFANVLSIRRNYRFASVYGVSAAGAILCATAGIYWSNSIFLALLCVPMAFQALVCLPLMLRELAQDLNMTSPILLREIFRSALSPLPRG